MRTFRAFMSHKFTYRQSLLTIGMSVLAGLIAIKASEAAGLSPAAVNHIGLAATITALIPPLVIFYRRANI